MRATLTGFQVGKASPAPEIHQALRAVGGSPTPHLLGYTAVARMNPFQALLYRSFGSSGVAVAPILRGHDFRVLSGFAPLSASQTIHFHWLSWVLGHVPDREDAQRKLGGLLGRVDRFKELGGRIAWTVHNVYPHDARFLDEELHLQQAIADRADVVHLMADSTTKAMDGILTIDPSVVVTAPHPSYEGAYEDVVSRADARAALGIDADEVVFVIFGALKRYKGLGDTLSAFQLLCETDRSTRYRLLVAGHADDDPDVDDFVDRCLLDPRVSIDPRRIPSDKTQYYLRAADVGLVTYNRSLNSGAALLYLTFGLPVVATDTPVLRETLPVGTATWVTAPSHSDARTLAEGMAKAAAAAEPSDVVRVKASIEHLHSTLVSARFRDQIAPRLGWSAGR